MNYEMANGQVIDEFCTVGEEKKVVRGVLYAAYRQWCSKPENKYNPMGSTTFYNEIAVRGYPPKRLADGWYINGIDVAPERNKEGRIQLT